MARSGRSLVGILYVALVLFGAGCAGQRATNPEAFATVGKQQPAQAQGGKGSAGGGASSDGSLQQPNPLPGRDSSINDIGCRKKLELQDADGNPWKSGDKNALQQARVATDYPYPGCHELSAVERLIFENAVAGASESYTNLAGFPSATAPIVQQSGNVYQFGIGYSQKPLLKQLRRLVHYNADDPAISSQGSWSEDFIYNAILFNAGVAYGQSLVIKNGTATTSSYSRPSYSVGMTYSLDLERAWIHLIYGSLDDARPADQGYYYTPQQRHPGFWPQPTLF